MSDSIWQGTLMVPAGGYLYLSGPQRIVANGGSASASTFSVYFDDNGYYLMVGSNNIGFDIDFSSGLYVLSVVGTKQHFEIIPVDSEYQFGMEDGSQAGNVWCYDARTQYITAEQQDTGPYEFFVADPQLP